MALISLTEWAMRNGIAPKTARDHAARGNLKSAQKIARNWVVEEDEQLIDHRIRTGKYRDWRKKPETK